MEADLTRIAESEKSWQGWVKEKKYMLDMIKNRKTLIKDYDLVSLTVAGLKVSILAKEEKLNGFLTTCGDKLTDQDPGLGGDGADEDLCTICGMEFTQPSVTSFLCGHTSCKECLQSMVMGAENNMEVALPLQCVRCFEGIHYDDIAGLTSKKAFDFIKDCAVGKFVLENKESYRYCPTPDCGNGAP